MVSPPAETASISSLLDMNAQWRQQEPVPVLTHPAGDTLKFFLREFISICFAAAVWKVPARFWKEAAAGRRMKVPMRWTQLAAGSSRLFRGFALIGLMLTQTRLPPAPATVPASEAATSSGGSGLTWALAHLYASDVQPHPGWENPSEALGGCGPLGNNSR